MPRRPRSPLALVRLLRSRNGVGCRTPSLSTLTRPPCSTTYITLAKAGSGTRATGELSPLDTTTCDRSCACAVTGRIPAAHTKAITPTRTRHVRARPTTPLMPPPFDPPSAEDTEHAEGTDNAENAETT